MLRDALIVVVIFVVVGAVSGFVWHLLWAPAPEGLVFDGVPRFDNDQEFRSTGLYLIIATVAGLIVGLLCTYVFECHEVWTLMAVALGSVAAGFVMLGVGHALGPDSAASFAEQAEDFEKVRGDLHATWLAVGVSFPAGALLGSVTVLSIFAGRTSGEPDR